MLQYFIHLVEFDTVGGVAYAEMLGRSNFLAIVGGGQAPKFPDRNGVVNHIWSLIMIVL